MGIHVEERTFTPSVTFITTDTRREEQPRVPLIGVNAGCMPGRSPGTPVKVLEAELRDLRGAQTANGTSRLKISKQASANGILRTRRRFV